MAIGIEKRYASASKRHCHLKGAKQVRLTRALADQKDDPELAALFDKLANQLEAAEDTINDELNGVQGQSVALNGYYRTNPDNVTKTMRPSATFNEALESLCKSSYDGEVRPSPPAEY